MYSFYHHIVAVSRRRYSDLKSTNPFLRNKLNLIENGFDIELFKTGSVPHSSPKKLLFDDRYRYIAIVGRLFPDKGHRYLFDALKLISSKHDNLKLLIVGDGPLRPQLVSLGRQLGIADKIHFCGIVENMHEIYSHLSALVIPSLREGLPYVLLEALAFRVPVVASAVGGIPQVIRDNHSGFLVEPANPEALCNALLAVLGSEAAEKSVIEENGFRIYMETYSHVPMIQRTEAMYRSAVLSDGD